MNGLRTYNTIRQASRAATERELAERAARADALIAWSCCVGLAVFVALRLAGVVQ